MHIGAGNAGKTPLSAAVAALLILAGFITFSRDSAPLTISVMRRELEAFPAVSLPINTPAALYAGLSCVRATSAPLRVNLPLPQSTFENVLACPPTAELAQFLQNEVGTNSIIAANAVNAFPLTMFAPVQILAWPITTTYNLILPQAVAPKFYASLSASLQRGIQPFFNTVETLEERNSFIKEQGVTHVVVDPMYYDQMVPLLNVLSGYERQFDKDKWAVFKVTRSAR